MKRIASILFFLLVVINLNAFDLWQFPESAEKNSLFVDVKFASLLLEDGFNFSYPEFSLDYMLPFSLPFSAGGFIKIPSPNLKSFGSRLAYHINIKNERTDLYFLHVFDFGFVRNDLLEAYNDEPQPVRYYDFRAGLRWRFNKYLCIVLESAYKFQGLNMGLSIKSF